MLTLTKNALSTETGVHIVVTTVNNKVKSSVVADIGTTSGTETYTSGAETFTITVTPNFAYLSGSKTGLVNIMGLSAAEQKAVGTDTIIMKKGTSQYTTFHSNLTSGAFSQLLPAARVRRSWQARQGHQRLPTDLDHHGDEYHTQDGQCDGRLLGLEDAARKRVGDHGERIEQDDRSPSGERSSRSRSPRRRSPTPRSSAVA